MDSIRNTLTVFNREIRSYFQAPVAYVFLVVFLILTGFLTFSVTQFYERGTADLQPFFAWHPWVYLLLVPAATMGVWAEERRAGTIELLLTMPLTLTQAVVGKFLAAWTFIALAILLTLPIVPTTLYLGNPDLGVITAAYLGSILMAGAYVAIGTLMSSLSRSQVIGFVLGLITCLLFLLAGWEPITGIFVRMGAPAWVVESVALFGFMPHYDSITRGVVDLRDVAYFISVIVFMLMAAQMVLDNRKSA